LICQVDKEKDEGKLLAQKPFGMWLTSTI
jgi:hypothetical protein